MRPTAASGLGQFGGEVVSLGDGAEGVEADPTANLGVICFRRSEYDLHIQFLLGVICEDLSDQYSAARICRLECRSPPHFATRFSRWGRGASVASGAETPLTQPSSSM